MPRTDFLPDLIVDYGIISQTKLLEKKKIFLFEGFERDLDFKERLENFRSFCLELNSNRFIQRKKTKDLFRVNSVI